MDAITTLTICGSMQFTEQMQMISRELELSHKINVIQPIYGILSPSEEDIKLLDILHKRKIDLSDGIYVVDINHYIGEGCKREIAYAREHGKRIIYHSEFVDSK